MLIPHCVSACLIVYRSGITSLCWVQCLQVCDRVPELRSDLQEPTVLVREPGPRGHGGPDRDPAYLARGEPQHLPQKVGQAGPKFLWPRNLIVTTYWLLNDVLFVKNIVKSTLGSCCTQRELAMP